MNVRRSNPATTAVIAHRGASRAEPENTLAAFERAGRMGADAVELDVRRTADGVLVVHHNPHLADGRLIAALRRADIPAVVPDLGDALDACQGMWVNVEIKNDPDEPDFDPDDLIAEETVALLLARDEDERWLISSFRRETVDRCRAIAPDVRTAWLCVEVPDEAIDDLARAGHAAIHPWVGVVTADLVEQCRRRGVGVNTWTCDDPEVMAQLIAWGIDGICTNVPDVALRVRAGEAV